MTRWEQALVEVEVERKLQVSSCPAMSTQHSSLEKAKEARKFCKKLEDTEERLGLAQITASREVMALRQQSKKRPILKRTM